MAEIPSVRLRTQSDIGPSLPSAALPASGSRGRPVGPLSHRGSPAILAYVRV